MHVRTACLTKVRRFRIVEKIEHISNKGAYDAPSMTAGFFMASLWLLPKFVAFWQCCLRKFNLTLITKGKITWSCAKVNMSAGWFLHNGSGGY